MSKVNFVLTATGGRTDLINDYATKYLLITVDNPKFPAYLSGNITLPGAELQIVVDEGTFGEQVFRYNLRVKGELVYTNDHNQPLRGKTDEEKAQYIFDTVFGSMFYHGGWESKIGIILMIEDLQEVKDNIARLVLPYSKAKALYDNNVVTLGLYKAEGAQA